VADPENAIVSPTFQVREARGVVMIAVGGVLFTLIESETVPIAPSGSETRSRAVYVPEFV
jgi:hypothetical protein